MSHPIDPRLYPAPPVPSHPSQGSYDSPRPGLAPADHAHQLASLSHSDALHQPYYRLPPDQTPLQHHPSQYEQLEDPTAPYEGHYGSQVPYEQEAGSDSGIIGVQDKEDESKRSRACEACRGLKVRCDRDENEPDRPCKRCAKARRTCVITAPSRKRQKKTDSRVAELEKKIDALTADLRKHQGGNVTATPDPYARDGGPISPPQSSGGTTGVTTPHQSGAWKREMEDRTALRAESSRQAATLDGLKRRTQDDNLRDVGTKKSVQRPKSSDSSVTTSSRGSTDVTLDSIVNPETSRLIFDRYVAEMAQYLPAVMFEPNTTAEEIRSKRPVLFLSIVDTASIGILELEVQYKLNQMLLDLYADRILRQGEKSLDLVQALMVSTIWYRPPRRYDQMNVYLLTHISALMALDFGMGRKLNASRSMRVAANVGQSQAPKTFLRSDSVEARRTWLGCYFVCMNVSLSLRRPNFIRWNTYLDECIKVLESAPETLPSDKRLCQHVKLMHINEEVGIRFSMDDPSATIAVSDPRVQFAIGAFEKRLDEWSVGVPSNQWDLSLEFSKHFSRLYMHEIALHNNHNIDDFRAPFTEESLKAPSLQAKSLTPYHHGLLGQCLAAVHDMFKAFSAFDMVTLKALPIFYFVRIAYAVVVLIKLHYAVCDPGNDLHMKQEDLLVEEHLDSLLQKFHRMAAEDSFRPARMFMIIITKLRDGFKRSKQNPAGIQSGAETQQFYSMEPTSRQRKESKSKDKESGNRKGTSSKASPVSASDSRKESKQHKRSPPPLQHQAQPMVPQQYSSAQTPLHFLSEVATNNVHGQNMPGQNMQGQIMQGQFMQGNMTYVGWSQQPLQYPPGMMTHGPEYGIDPAFEQAVDMTMGIGEGDLSSLFMEDGGYTYPPGVFNDRLNTYVGHVPDGW